MNVLYYDVNANKSLEDFVTAYGGFLKSRGEEAITCRRVELEELLRESDVVSLHTDLSPSTKHLINAARLATMKPNAILVNTSRGPVIDEPDFRVGLDVFEDEPKMKPGLADLENVVVVPHIASATVWTREGMATLAATNVAAVLQGLPAWNRPDIEPFLRPTPPAAAPSIVNAAELKYPLLKAAL